MNVSRNASLLVLLCAAVSIPERGTAATIDAGTFLGGSAAESQEVSQNMALASDGSVIVIGNTTSTDFPATLGAYDTALNTSGTVAQDMFVAKYSPDLSALTFATLLGGSEAEYASSVTLGPDGSIYVIGRTDSSDFPVTPGAFQSTYQGGVRDGFIVRLSADGETLLYSTFLGGVSTDWGRDIAVDSSGKIYTLSETWSNNWPISVGAFQTSRLGRSEFAVTVLDSAGSNIQFSTFIGGTSDEYAARLLLDGSGSVYVVGFSRSTDYPTTSGVVSESLVGDWDTVLTKLTSDGTAAEFSTYVGGSGYETCRGAALGSGGSVWLSGSTQSANFPVTPAHIDNTLDGTSDAYLLNLNSNGQTILYSTLLGGSDTLSPEQESARSIAMLSDGSVLASIDTASADFPTAGGPSSYSGNGDLMLAVVDPLQNTMPFASYVGGTTLDVGTTLAVKVNGDIIVTGETQSANFPVPPTSIDSTHNGANDVFALQITSPVISAEGEGEGQAEGEGVTEGEGSGEGDGSGEGEGEGEGGGEGEGEGQAEGEGEGGPIDPTPGMPLMNVWGILVLIAGIALIAGRSLRSRETQ